MSIENTNEPFGYDAPVKIDKRIPEVLAALQDTDLSTEQVRGALKLTTKSTAYYVLCQMAKQQLIRKYIRKVKTPMSCGVKMVKTAMWTLVEEK